MLLTLILIFISFSSITVSFIPDLPFLQILPAAAFFSSGLTIWFPRLFSVTFEHIRFYFLVFLFYTFQLLFPCGRLSWLVSAFERTLKWHLVSYRIVFRHCLAASDIINGSTYLRISKLYAGPATNGADKWQPINIQQEAVGAPASAMLATQTGARWARDQNAWRHTHTRTRSGGRQTSPRDHRLQCTATMQCTVHSTHPDFGGCGIPYPSLSVPCLLPSLHLRIGPSPFLHPLCHE